MPWGESAVCPLRLLNLRRERYLLELCAGAPGVATAAVGGLEEALAECRRQMRWQPWPCGVDGARFGDQRLF